MVPSSARGYLRGMRVNLLWPAAIGVLSGLSALYRHDLWMGVPLVGLGLAMVPLHFIRVRRFKRYDQSRTFD